MKTKWKPVCGHENSYAVSSDGNVKNIRTGKVLKPRVERNGYVRVHLSTDGRSEYKLLHRLVAETFIPNPNGYLTVNHIDENKQNNSADNLEWADMHYQNTYGQGAVSRNDAKKRPIIQLTMDGIPIRSWDSASKAAKELNLSPSSIACVCKGIRRYKSTGGFKFRYEGEVIRHG